MSFQNVLLSAASAMLMLFAVGVDMVYGQVDKTTDGLGKTVDGAGGEVRF